MKEQCFSRKRLLKNCTGNGYLLLMRKTNNNNSDAYRKIK